MGTINGALNVIGGALDADQSALNVVANNVANANTPGYTEEMPTWRQNMPIYIDGLQIGTGVTETGFTSKRDRVLLQRLDQQQQLASASSTRLAALNNIAALFTPNAGASSSVGGDIGSAITGFFNSFASMEADPTNTALREQVLSSAALLAGNISSAASSLEKQQAALDQEAAGIAGQVNSLTSAIAQLNLAIQSTSPNGDAGALEDQRQRDISQLAQLIGINQVTTEDNGLSLTTTSGQLLVSQGQSYEMTTGEVNGLTQFFVGGENIAQPDGTAVGGELGGYLTARDVDVPSALASLDQLAYGISTSVNAQNNAGADLDGVSGSTANPLNIFSQPAQVSGSATAMAVVMIDPAQIAAAGAGKGTGDNSNAVALANLASGSLFAPSASTAFSITQNLSSATAVNAQLTGTATVYDADGKSYQATVTYTNQGGGQWSYEVSLADTLTPDTSVAGQVTYSFGASGGTAEGVAQGTDLTITGTTSSGGTATIIVPPGTPGESPAAYAAELNAALAAANITGVSVTTSGAANDVLTIAGATALTGGVTADALAAGAGGTLSFNSGGVLTSPAGNVAGMTFSGLSDGAAPLSLTWELYGAGGAPQLTQTAAASAQTAASQDGSPGRSQSPIDFYSSLVSTLGSTVAQANAENTAQNASVAQLQSQNNALSSVNLNDEAAALSLLETSYQAASQVFTILNSVMASALNLGVSTAVA